MDNLVKINNIGVLLPSEDELEFMREQFVEATGLHGRVAKLYQVDTEKWHNTDAEYSYKDPVEVNYTLDANPSISTISKYGWFSEDTKNHPVIAYLTYHDTDNRPVEFMEGCKLELTSKRSIQEGDYNTKLFKVWAVATDLELNMAVLNLVPDYQELKQNVKVVETPADPMIENKYFRREETWSSRIEG